MDIASKMPTIVTLFIIIVLIIIFRINKTKKNKSVLKNLREFARETNSSITDFNYWNNTEIGIDKNNGTLFFIRKTKNDETRLSLPLQQITQCRIGKTTRSVGSGKNSQNVIDRIELILSNHKTNKETHLEFYNSAYDNLQIKDELQISEKWNTLINSTRVSMQ